MTDYLSGPTPLIYYVSATSNDTRNSSTDAAIASMTFTPPAGTYLATFNSDMNSNAAGAAITTSFYVAGVQQGTSIRKIIPFDGGTLSATAARGIMHVEDIVNLNGAQTITVQWSISSGTATVAVRTFTLLRGIQL